MTKVVVTGAAGFIGRNLVPVLEQDRYTVIPIFRADPRANKDSGNASGICRDVGPWTDWTKVLEGIDVVVHLVARTHSSRDTGSDNIEQYRAVNVQGTSRLATQASAAGVKRFVFLSSIKVNGERTEGSPFSVDDTPAPEDAYGVTKLEAEDALRKIGKETGMEVVIIRPPLVYGPGVKGNLLSLTNAISRGLPLPIGVIKNSRSLVSVYNLCDLIRVCVSSPEAAGNTFMVADTESISTIDLVRYIAQGLGRSAILFSLPGWVLKGVASLLGKRQVVEKLTSSLLIDSSRTHEILQWSPPFTVEESFKMMFAHEAPE